MLRSRNVCICLALFSLFGFVLVYLNGNQTDSAPRCAEGISQPSSLYKNWKECILSKLEAVRGNHTQLWKDLETLTSPCNQPYANALNIRDFANKGEVKYHIPPLVNAENSTLVTLGVGFDIAAEEKLMHTLGRDRANFYGADPIHDVNEELYGKIGKYYPVAVAGKAGYGQAQVLEAGAQSYKKSTVVYVDAVYFLTKMVGLKFYDALWIDNEYGEYDMMPMFSRGGDFDQNGITVCQFNMEIHVPSEEQKKLTHDFLFQMLKEERYAFFFVLNVSHLRVYFVNLSDAACIRKYIPQEFDRSRLCY